MMACLIVHNIRWRRSYTVLREYHNEGMFGERCVSELTDMQLELLNLSQLYDVVQTAVAQYYGEDDDGVEREVPAAVLPYPGRLLKWYEKWKEKGKRTKAKPNQDTGGRSIPRKQKPKLTTVFVDNESNAEAFAATRRLKKSR